MATQEHHHGINEKISEQDRQWVSKRVNYDTIRAVSRWAHRFDPPNWIWTVDREREFYLINLGGKAARMTRAHALYGFDTGWGSGGIQLRPARNGR
jgi:hypothetical protein